jgi:hypothetical protein
MEGMVGPALTPLTPWQLLQVRARPSIGSAAVATPVAKIPAAEMANNRLLFIISS